MHTTDIGLSDKNRAGVAALLNTLLADEFLLYTKTRNFHWNVTGPHFHDYHKFFEALYEELDGIMDEVAERTRSLGERPLGSMAEFIRDSRLKESKERLEAKKMIAVLLEDNEKLIKTLRKDLETCDETFHDQGTTDFLTGLMEQHEKMAWMLRAHLE